MLSWQAFPFVITVMRACAAAADPQTHSPFRPEGNVHVSRVVHVVAIALALACRSGQPIPDTPAPEPTPAPTDDRPIYGITVEDATEISLLKEKLGIEPVIVAGTTLYFAGRAPLLDSLRSFGYTPELADIRAIRTQVIGIQRRGTEAELTRLGVRVINREEDRWIASATIGQVEALRRLGYVIAPLREGEPKAREVRIIVQRRGEIARIGELHVDIYSSRDTAGVVEVRAGAFDDQIDRMRALGYTVELIGTTPP
jgi:hypothetical protein